MTPELIFLVQALAILVLPVAVWHVLCLRGRVPLVVVQILVGVALGGLWIITHQPAELIGGVNPLAFATAIGICIGVTALPVLGAILREMDLLGRRIGNYALGIAAVNDAALWLLLGGLVTAVAGKAPGSPGVLISVLGLPVYLAAMVWLVPPLLRRSEDVLLRDGRMRERSLAGVCAVALASAMAR